MREQIKVMVAGIGGASLGTEIRKSLNLAGCYEIFGCDVSKTAYGLYEPEFSKTWLVSRDDYISSVLNTCIEAGVNFLVPGGEEPSALLSAAAAEFEDAGVRLLINSLEIITAYSDKAKAFQHLAECGIPVPRTVLINKRSDLDQIGLPCIVKPATGSGGSAAVFFATSANEAMIYADFIRRNGNPPVGQEYVDEGEGEYSIGVLSLPNGQVAGSIALRRALDAKLSVVYRGRGGLISSGYTQGHIAEYGSLCQQAERIGEAIGSRGPINIQGRVRDGILLPFEINPRFSASTFLRAMAGFNEVDILIKYLVDGELMQPFSIKSGWYFRSLIERYVAAEELKL